MRRRRRRGPQYLKCSHVPCIQISLLGRVVQLYGISYTLCYSCGVPTCTRSRYQTNEPYPFPICTSCILRKQHLRSKPSNYCFVCKRPSPKMKTVRVFDDCNLQECPWSFASLCHRHSRKSWNESTILLKSVLLNCFHRT